MNNTIQLTHLATGKVIVIVDRKSISALFTGDMVMADKTYPGATWIVIDKVSQPIPVKESQQEVLELLGLNQGE